MPDYMTKKLIDHTYKVVHTRHPFSRLYSAYNDKFLIWSKINETDEKIIRHDKISRERFFKYWNLSCWYQSIYLYIYYTF